MYNVKDTIYGATGNGTTDDTAAIQAAINAANAAGGGDVFLPNGTYIVSNAGLAGAGCLYPKTGVRMFGESKLGTTIKLAPNQPAMTRPICPKDCSDIAIRNMTIDGNKANQATQEEHRAAIFLMNVTRTYLADLVLLNNTGDGLDLYQANDTVMERVYAHDNGRKAVSINGGGGSRDMTFRDCDFENNNGQLHIEAQGTVYDLFIENVRMGEPSLGGYPLSLGNVEGAYVSGCEIYGGLNVTAAKRVRITDCYVETGVQPAGPCPMIVQLDVEDFVATGCTFNQTAGQTGSNQIVYVAGASSMTMARPRRIRFEGCRMMTAATYSFGLQNLSVESVEYIGCTVENTNPANATWAIGASSQDPAFSPMVGTVAIRDCSFIGWYGQGTFGVPTSGQFKSLVLDGCTWDAAGVAAHLGLDLHDFGALDGFAQIQMTDLEFLGIAAPVYTWPTTPILVGGVRGGPGATYSCAGSPEGMVTEVPGARALSRAGGAGTTLYVKETGTGATGWIGK